LSEKKKGKVCRGRKKKTPCWRRAVSLYQMPKELFRLEKGRGA